MIWMVGWLLPMTQTTRIWDKRLKTNIKDSNPTLKTHFGASKSSILSRNFNNKHLATLPKFSTKLLSTQKVVSTSTALFSKAQRRIRCRASRSISQRRDPFGSRSWCRWPRWARPPPARCKTRDPKLPVGPPSRWCAPGVCLKSGRCWFVGAKMWRV